jgi:hypothetical protein
MKATKMNHDKKATMAHERQEVTRVASEEIFPGLEEQGYFNVRVIDEVTCSLMRFMYTVAIVIDMSPFTYGRRYCYEKQVDAESAFAVYTDTTTHPTGPWIKCKGIMNGSPVDMLNPTL